MILLLLAILLVVGWVVGIVAAVAICKRNVRRDYGSSYEAVFWTVFVGAAAVFGPIYASCDISNKGYHDNGVMLGLQQSIGIYERTARDLNSVSVVEPAGGAAISGIENMRQSTNASGAWLDYRNKQVDVNLLVAKRKAQLRNPWINWLIPPLPPELESWGK